MPKTSEQLALVQRTFGLNKTQLAEVCHVQRQTVYDWYAAKFEAEGDNADRVERLYRVASLVRSAGIHALPLKAVERQLPHGNKLLDLLRAPVLAAKGIRQVAEQLQGPRESIGRSAQAIRQRLGWARLDEETRAKQLEENLDDLLEA